MSKKCASCHPYERAFVFSPTQANSGSDTPLISSKRTASPTNFWKHLVLTEKQHVAKPWTTEQCEIGDICILHYIIAHSHIALTSLMIDREMKQISAPPRPLSHKDKMYILKALSRIS